MRGAYQGGPTRRTVLKTAAASAALAAIPAGAFASVMPIPARRIRTGGGTLGKYLCSQVHEKMAVQLDEIIADPAIDGEGTALALMEARCPGCGERVHPKNSAISAVIPQWQWVDDTETKIGV